MKRGSLRGSALWLCVALVVPIGCGRAINRSAERRIRDALPELLGPAKAYHVHVENAPERTVRGRLANVTVDGENVQLANGLLLDQLHLDLNGVEVDTGRGRVKRIQETRFTAVIRAASLDEYMAADDPPGETVRKVRLTLRDNQVTIAAERVVLGLSVPFRIMGPLRLASPQRIEIDATRLTVVGIPFTGLPLRFLKSRFESAIDLSQLPFPIRITSAQATEGRLLLTGTADTEGIILRAQEQRK